MIFAIAALFALALGLGVNALIFSGGLESVDIQFSKLSSFKSLVVGGIERWLSFLPLF